MADFGEPFFGFGAHWWEDGGPDWDEDDAERLDQLRREREAQKAADKAENKRRRWPPRCGYCGSAYETTHTYGDDPECVGMPYVYEQAAYECGTEIGGHNDQTFEERVRDGQSNACRTIMELRWKTDREALERDRTDTRTDVEKMTVEQEREWVQKQRHAKAIQQRREVLARLTDTETWVDAQGHDHTIADMNFGHLRNCLSWLEQCAPVFQRFAQQVYWHEVDTRPIEDQARSDEDLYRDPVEWMKDQPVYQRMKAQVAASAPVSRRISGYQFVPSPTPPPVPGTH